MDTDIKKRYLRISGGGRIRPAITLVKDEESARDGDNHLLACILAKYSLIYYFSLADSAINLS